jgi:RNA polymerase sigma-70 factor (ECF subfamily)
MRATPFASSASRDKSPNDLEWEGIYREHSDAVYWQAMVILRNADDANDVTQNTFVKAHKNWDRYDKGRSLKAWLLGIASKEALHFARGRRVRAWLPLMGSEPALDDPPSNSAVWPALQSLPEKHRAVVAMFYLHGFSIEEIAAVTGIPSGTVGSRLHVARKKLRDILQGQEV